MIFFTADEHYGHDNIIKYCNRPYSSVKDMDYFLIKNHNSMVLPQDTVYHLGDFCFKNKLYAESIISKLNGMHFFLRGSHDSWNKSKILPYIWEGKIEDAYVVLCHYAMARWPRSHYNSWHLYGHSHGEFSNQGKSYDVGVDNNDYYPVSFFQLKDIMSTFPDNVPNHAKTT